MQNITRFIVILFCLSSSQQAQGTIIYTDPYERFTLTFPVGWGQGQTSDPNQQAYFSYTENGVALAEVIIYSYRLPHAMEAVQLKAQIFESLVQQHPGTIMPDPASIAVRNFGMYEGITDEMDYWTQNQTPMRMKNFYLIHAYTGTGIVMRFGTFKQHWTQMLPKLEEVMKGFKVSVTNITLETLQQQNLLSVTESPMIQHPESFEPAYPWKTETPSTPYDQSILENARLLKAAALNDPALKATLPHIEKVEKEYGARVLQAQLHNQPQPQTAAQTHATTTGPNATNPGTLPQGSALSTILGGPQSDDLTGNIYGELEAPLPQTPQDVSLPTLDFTTWEDPWNRFSMIYPKGYTKTQKGQWYLSFDGPAGIQFLVLVLMDPPATMDYLKSQLKGQRPIEEREVQISNPRIPAHVYTFRTRNENLELLNDTVTLGILPNEGNILFLVTFPEERYRENEAVVKKIIEHFIQNIQLKG